MQSSFYSVGDGGGYAELLGSPDILYVLRSSNKFAAPSVTPGLSGKRKEMRWHRLCP
jgi:hypothetical protein